MFHAIRQTTLDLPLSGPLCQHRTPSRAYSQRKLIIESNQSLILSRWISLSCVLRFPVWNHPSTNSTAPSSSCEAMMRTQSSFNFLRSSSDGITRVHDGRVCTLHQTQNRLSAKHQARRAHDGRLSDPAGGRSNAAIVSTMETTGITLTMVMNPRVMKRFPGESGIMAKEVGGRSAILSWL